jgi:hypothetical protein
MRFSNIMLTAITGKLPQPAYKGFHVACTVQGMLNSMSQDVMDHPPYNPELALCGWHVFGPPQEGAKGPKVKSGQRQWCGGTLIVTAAVQGILCGEFHCLVCKWVSCHNTCSDYCKWPILLHPEQYLNWFHLNKSQNKISDLSFIEGFRQLVLVC